MHPLMSSLQTGLDGLGLSVSAEQQAQLLMYVDLIAKWTKVYNLTAVRDANEMLTHHLLDSLAVVAPLRREVAKLVLPEGHPQLRMLDVGAGAALPSLVQRSR
jgi:16S rRNA (guanine527-N7)-methyltransferase